LSDAEGSTIVVRDQEFDRFMANGVRLDNVEHHALRVERRFAPEFGHCVNQILVVPAEFEAAQRDYPILFRREADGAFQSLALLGLDRGENLYLDGGTWRARYIPAFVSREPLYLGAPAEEGEEGGLAPYIDLDDPRVGEEGGEPLFLPQGGRAPFLEEAAAALATVHDGLFQMRAMFDAFSRLGLLQPVNLDIRLPDGLEYRIGDVFTVSADQLRDSSKDDLDELRRSGFLAHAIFARASLGNMDRLIAWKSERLANG
jgi:hypothetical protein